MDVLVVEDSESTRELLGAILRARGHEVTPCADAEQALAKYQPDRYPLVVLDWLLPGLDGVELCRRLRSMPGGDRSIILVVTARNQPDDLKIVLDAGADDYVAKPIDVDALGIRFTVAEGAAKHLLKRKQAEAELARAFASIEKSRDNLLSILSKSRTGTVLIDPNGVVTFLSPTARELLGHAGVDPTGKEWDQVVQLSAEDRQMLVEMVQREEGERAKVSVTLDHDGLRRWADIEVMDDPRDPRGKIFFLYDQSDLHSLRLLLDEKARFHDLVGRSGVMGAVYERIRRVAQVDSSVLIEGETGTGKELVARAIHFSGHRRNGPFIAVNCAGLTESILASQLFGHCRGAFTGAVSDHKGFFESAERGTIFLDEIGDLPAGVQTSLLRVLQEREILRLGESLPRKVDVRVVTATHHDLAADAEAGLFRADLLYRIRVARISLPPLRDRREDIPLLVKAFLTQLRAMREQPVEDVSKDALRLLMAHRWPGNVRELRAAVEYAVIHCDVTVIQASDLPPEIMRFETVPATVAVTPPRNEQDERRRILAALEEARGNRSLAAESLGMSRSTFYRRLAELGLVAATRR